MLDRIITYSFYLLFLITPLFWSSLNYELFEFNKMLLVYAFTIIIVGCWLLKSINQKPAHNATHSVAGGSLIINRTPLDIPLLLFLGANILSTIFSIDTHTSIFGYYSRLNGGLLSLVSYLLLYWAFVSNMDKTKAIKTLKFGLISGFVISLWAIFEHFGVSFSCVILRGEFNTSCWIQDVQARVFASLGQPNWLAAYLSMLIFPALYFLFTATNKKQSIIYYLLSITLYLAFTFTYSRGPTLGLIAGMVIFIICYLFCHPEGKTRRISELVSNPTRIRERFFTSFRMTGLFGILGTFLIVNILFGSALTSFRLVSKFAPPPRPGIELPKSNITQLENGGTESGQIRYIVWEGAVNIFKAYPLFGSGLETFAYSYYQFRPVAHNLTSEWDFLYNKAHNEYLNYLATTGLVGFTTYMLVIGSFIFWCIKYYVSSIKQKKHNTYYLLLTTSLLASYVSYLIYNFFLFSVVIIAVFFYLFPALIFVISDSQKPLIFHSKLSIVNWLYRRAFYTYIAKVVVILTIIYSLFSVYKLWLADTIFNEGQSASESGNPGKAYNLLTAASIINNSEPFYKSELGYNAASAAVALASSEATLSAELKNEAFFETEAVLKDNPKNTSYWRSAIRTYFELSTIDPEFTNKTIDVLNTTISLAPTDPKLYFNKALVLESIGQKQEAIKSLQKALELKPNYLEVKVKLEEATKSAPIKSGSAKP